MKFRLPSIFFFGLILAGYVANAQDESNDADSLTKHFDQLLKSNSEADKALLRTNLYTLLKSNDENDWTKAQSYFYRLKDQRIVDSISKAEKIKFPEGVLVRRVDLGKVYDAKDGAEKERLYNAWMQRFPPEKFGKDRIVYDYARNSIATAYAEEGNAAKAVHYANMTETDVWKGEGWASVAQIFIKQNKHIDEAKTLIRKAINNSYEFMTTRKDEYGAPFAASGYLPYINMYSGILLKEKNYEEALEYVEKAYQAYKDKGEINGKVNAQYAQVLQKLGKDKEAFDKIDEALHAGQATPDMKTELKKLYVEVKGSDAGYEDYLAKANKLIYEGFIRTLPKQMINQPAPAFALKDVNGKTVSLSDYKGKVVILDFWATWCGPCKASFPSMKKAINKYENDPDVEFLFIHTWERGDSATEKAKEYITANQYPFEVLMDLKDPQTGSNKVVESYKVSGIPAKFVIDKNGNVRFKLTGFSGGMDAAVEEISAMIALAKSHSS